MFSLTFVGTEKIQDNVNNNTSYKSQKVPKFATKKKQSIIATKKISLIMIKIKPKI